MNFIFSECMQITTINAALDALDTKVQINTIIHKISNIINDKFYHLLVADETGHYFIFIYIHIIFS